MGKFLQAFHTKFFAKNAYTKLFKKHVPGKRVFPTRSGNNDETFQLRIDAGEEVDGKQQYKIQVNSQAKDPQLKKWRNKHGTHANIATASVDTNTPKEDQRKVADKFWSDVEDQVRDSLDD
ncbi:MAG: hypothetical protein Q9174_004699 [Haloplaca sp. 1 TL-2023]